MQKTPVNYENLFSQQVARILDIIQVLDTQLYDIRQNGGENLWLDRVDPKKFTDELENLFDQLVNWRCLIEAIPREGAMHLPSTVIPLAKKVGCKID